MNSKKIFIAAVLAILVAAACFFGISSREGFYSVESPLWESGPSVTLTIDCSAASENLGLLPPELQDERYAPSGGYILKPTRLALVEGDTAYSAFLRAVKYYGIPFEAQGVGEAVYVTGINQLYEFSAGELSGWMYSVNGEYPSEGCGSYTLKEGDEVCFVYTLDLTSVSRGGAG